MARKEQITKQIIVDGAFGLLREQGIQMVTARKLAAYAGCSTQPIFRHFENMDEWRDLLKDNGFTDEEIEEEEAKSEFYYAGGEDFVEVYN